MSGVTDFEGYLHGQIDSVGATPANTRTGATQLLRRRRFTWLKTADDAMASTTTAETQVGGFAVAGTVKAIYYISNGTLTGDDTNNAVVTVSKRTSAGGSKTTLGTLTTNVAGGNYVQGQRIAFALTATVANLTLAALATISFEIAKGGSGVVVRAGAFEIEDEED